MSEKEKMLAGKPYFAFDTLLLKERKETKEKLYFFNNLHPNEVEKGHQIIKSLFGKIDGDFVIEPPFRCDYGYNIKIGSNFFANYNLTVLDCAKVSIGNNVLIGPNVSLFAAGHPIHHDIRNLELEYAFPINIGDNVWIGGNVVINANINIGNNSVIASGSVVTKDIPNGVVAAGNPCRVMRVITEADKAFYFKNLKL